MYIVDSPVSFPSLVLLFSLSVVAYIYSRGRTKNSRLAVALHAQSSDMCSSSSSSYTEKEKSRSLFVDHRQRPWRSCRSFSMCTHTRFSYDYHKCPVLWNDRQGLPRLPPDALAAGYFPFKCVILISLTRLLLLPKGIFFQTSRDWGAYRGRAHFIRPSQSFLKNKKKIGRAACAPDGGDRERPQRLFHDGNQRQMKINRKTRNGTTRIKQDGPATSLNEFQIVEERYGISIKHEVDTQKIKSKV